MIDPNLFLAELQSNQIEFFCGVPDSLLKDFLLALQEKFQENQGKHIIAANEGSAVAMASGYQMASGKLPLVYMQNSGLGNAVNPLMSLAHKRVYSIPMLLLIGHRGEPGKHDEPQHLPMGEATVSLLADLNVDMFFLNAASKIEIVTEAAALARKNSAPVAILVSSGSFSSAAKVVARANENLSRESALEIILTQGKADAICATTGFTARELYELRVGQGERCASPDFLNVGAMGHVSQIALGAALACPEKRVMALDGDGSLLMHLGGLATIGQSGVRNIVHVLLNNRQHESVGGQPTTGLDTDFVAMAAAAGYRTSVSVNSQAGLEEALNTDQGPVFIEVKIRAGVKEKLGRPPDNFIAAKEAFSKRLQ